MDPGLLPQAAAWQGNTPSGNPAQFMMYGVDYSQWISLHFQVKTQNVFLLKWHKSKSKSVIRWFEIKMKNHQFGSDFKSESKDHQIDLKSQFQTE